MTAHVRLIRAFGGATGVRDAGLLQSALDAPLAAFEDHLRHLTPFQRAGALWLSLIRNHGFVDGNKRTATAAMTRWLVAEGLRLRCEQEQLVEMAVAIANGLCDLDDLAHWLEDHAHPDIQS
ncbi:MAG: type II toxin-antitoxin system death-on-curing family toxin [Candidatus Dormibacteraeota bacterium]|nr:type II toxin-antitoxin system death-on-curing family toxin [Candidatus Dormibacteraeota bacterium]